MSRADFSKWMPVYCADFDDSERVAMMDPAAEALYQRAIRRQWTHGSLPADVKALRALFPAKFSADFDSLWAQIADCFDLVDGRLVNARCAAERSRAESSVNARRAGAVKANAARSAHGERALSERSASANRPTSEKEMEKERESVPTPSVSGGTLFASAEPQSAEEGRKAPKQIKPAKPPAEKKPAEHVAVVEAWTQLWAFYRHDVAKDRCVLWTFENKGALTPAQTWARHDKDWVAAARIWRNCPDLKEVRRRICRMLESDANWARNTPSLSMLDSHWNHFDRAVDELERSA